MAKPRWFRFSLRTLFVVVTIFGVWLGWQLKWIRERREFLAAEAAMFVAHKLGYTSAFSAEYVSYRPPWPLGFFGETGYPHVGLYVDGPDRDNLTAEDRMKVDQAQRLFPESKIGLYHYGEEGIWDSLIPLK